MSDDFENNINQRMQDFRLSPTPQIWERVAAALPPEKKRRRFAIWWWLLPMAACLCGGIWLVIGGQKGNSVTNNKESTGKIPVQQNGGKQSAILIHYDTVINTIVQKPVSKKELPVTEKQSIVKENAPIKENEIVKSNHITKPQKQFQIANKKSKKIIQTAGEENGVVRQNLKQSKSETSAIANVLNNSAAKVQSGSEFHENSVYFNAEPILPIINSTNISTPQITVETDTATINKNDTLIIASKEGKPAKKSTKQNKTEWSIAFSIGRSTLNGGMSNDEKALYSSNLNSPVLSGPGSGATTNTGNFMEPNAGISFSAGIVRQQNINKHWGWRSTFTYQLLSSYQNTGKRNDSLTGQNYSADAFYARTLSGTSKYTNRVHRLQLATYINYTLNSSAHSPISFFAGASLACNISNTLLLHDYRTGYYIRSTSLYNKFLIGGIVGFDMFINKKIHAGLLFQHDFTNVGKPEIGSSFYWNQLQLSVGIPLSKHK